MSTILGADGNPTTQETNGQDAPRPGSNGRDKSEVQDVRTVPMGVLLYNLMLCANGMQMNKMTLDHIGEVMRQQKMVTEPPEAQHLKAIMEHQLMARNVMIGEINTRFKLVDAERVATMDMEVVDRTESPPPVAPAGPV